MNPNAERSHKPGAEVPASGIYDVVGEDGRYLGRQKVCHAGDPFPPTLSDDADGYELAYEAKHLDRLSIFRPGAKAPVSGVFNVVDEAGDDVTPPHQKVCREGRTFPPIVDENPAAHGYLLAYEATHLHPPSARHPAGHTVPVSGIYDLIDRDGDELGHQKACVKGERFPPIPDSHPGAFGYEISYAAERLSK